jgi:hypothetical protein
VQVEFLLNESLQGLSLVVVACLSVLLRFGREVKVLLGEADLRKNIRRLHLGILDHSYNLEEHQIEQRVRS